MVCLLIEDQPPVIQEFGTTTRELLRLGDFLAERQVPVVAMESTGVYWKPLLEILEGQIAEFDVSIEEQSKRSAKHARRGPR